MAGRHSPLVGLEFALRHLVFLQGLEDLGFSMPFFMWCNSRGASYRLWVRLDRAFETLELFQECRISHLPRTGSDHCPLPLGLGHSTSVRSSFLLSRASESAEEVFTSIWPSPMLPLFDLQARLSLLAFRLRRLHWKVFGSIEANLEEAFGWPS